MTRPKKLAISLFVICWLFLFNYESLRYKYLNPWVGRTLPKLRLLFPPAGWIMFFRISDQEGRIEVYGLQKGLATLIDPHDIFRTRFVLYDNIHRNVLINVGSRDAVRPFCRFLNRKFPQYEGFSVYYLTYPSVTRDPTEKYYQLLYQCPIG